MDDEKQITNNITGTVGVLVLVLFVVGVIGVFGYWYFAKNLDNNSQITQTPALVQTPKIPTSVTPIPTSDLTTDWNMLDLSEYEIFFKYPKNWERSKTAPVGYHPYVTNEPDNGLLYSVVFDEIDTEPKRTAIFSFAVFDKKELSTSEWISRYDMNYSNNKELRGYKILVDDKQTLFIGMDQVYVPYRNKIYTFQMYYTDYSAYPDPVYQEKFEQILSSVQFN